MKGERLLASSSAFIGTLNAGPPTSTSAREKAGAWPQLTIPPTAPFAADRGDLDRAAAGQLDAHAKSWSGRTGTGSIGPGRRG